MAEWQAAIMLAAMGLGGVLLLTYLLPITLAVATVFLVVATPIGVARELLRHQ